MRTKFDNNEIIEYEDYAEIVLYDKQNMEKARTIIDLNCITDVVGTKWYQRKDGYVATSNYNGEGKYKYMHAVLLNKHGNGTYVDHKDGNRLNNLLENLRIATPSQNGMNKKIRSNNTSGRTGVHWSKQQGKWCVMISVNKNHMNLGYFDNFEDACRCRTAAEEKYFGEFRATKERVSR